MLTFISAFKTVHFIERWQACRPVCYTYLFNSIVLYFCSCCYVLFILLICFVSIKLRKLISDFSIFMSIMTFVGLDMLIGLKTPKLIVPTEFKVRVKWSSTRMFWKKKLILIFYDYKASSLVFLKGVLVILFSNHVAHTPRPGLVCDAIRKESVVGLPGKLRPCSPRNYPHLHGSADQCCHCKPQGK